MREVNYNDIIIGFSKARSPWKVGSKIIQEGERRDYSHVYVKYKDYLTNVVLITQASHGMVNEMESSIFNDHNIVVKEYLLPTNEQQFIDIITFLKMNLGKPYSKLQLVFIAIKKAIGIEINIKNNDNAFICSELGARVCQIAKIDTNDVDYTTPSDLDRLLENVAKLV
jgi:hypothetical protein